MLDTVLPNPRPLVKELAGRLEGGDKPIVRNQLNVTYTGAGPRVVVASAVQVKLRIL